jgi:hypothetical protein
MFDTRKIKNALFAKSCSVSLMVAALVSSGQGTFIYDQQSGDESTANGPSLAIQAFPPFGQSFTSVHGELLFMRRLAVGIARSVRKLEPVDLKGVFVGVRTRQNLGV